MKNTVYKNELLVIIMIMCFCVFNGCTVKAVGDPDRPITIKAHITLDIKGLQNTADNIEDFVSGEKSKEELPVEKGGK